MGTQSTLAGQGLQNTGAGNIVVGHDVIFSSKNADDELLTHLHVTDPSQDKKRIEDTKGGLLADSYRWILDHDDFSQWRQKTDSRLLWIKGDPGKGKTMLLCGIINELDKASSVAGDPGPAYFFCQATDDRLNSATSVLRGLLYMIIKQHPPLISYLRDKFEHSGEARFKDVNTWIALSDVLSSMLADSALEGKVLLIDALDECVTDLQRLLLFISTTSCTKWIVSSRNWPTIEYTLRRTTSKITLRLELNADSVAAAVKTYVQHKVAELTHLKQWEDTTRDSVEEHLTKNADDTFLWVALVYQELADPQVQEWETLNVVKEFPPGLDRLYQRMMDTIFKSNLRSAHLCREVLAISSVVYRPLKTKELLHIMQSPDQFGNNVEALEKIIASCGSFLTIRDSTVYFIHQSAKDFLLEKASARIMPSGVAHQHDAVCKTSLEILSKTLRRDIYDLRAPAYRAKDIHPPERDPLAPVKYACVHWADHVQDSFPAAKLTSDHPVHDFLKQSYLHWLEAMSLMGSLPQAVLAIGKLRSIASAAGEARILADLVYDAHRFVLRHKRILEDYPLQVYGSALAFCPEDSLVRGLFQGQLDWIRRITPMDSSWDNCEQILSHPLVTHVAMSPNGRQIASGGSRGTVRLWDMEISACAQDLRGPEEEVLALIFSPDGKRIHAGFEDSTVWEWDAATGVHLHLFEPQSGTGRSNFMAVAFGCSRVASVIDHGKKIQIWDTERGVGYWRSQSPQNPPDTFHSIAFAPGGRQVAAGSSAGTIWVWDALTGTCLKKLQHDWGAWGPLSFSPDGKQLASRVRAGEGAVWDVATGSLLHTLKCHEERIQALSYSLDGKRLASVSDLPSDGSTIRIWDSSSGACLQTLECVLRQSIYSLALSPDGQQVVSSHYHKGEIRIWSVRTSAGPQMLEKHDWKVISVTLSPNRETVVSVSWDGTIWLWDTNTGNCRTKLDIPEGEVSPYDEEVGAVAFSRDSRLLATCSPEGTVRLWQAATGALLDTIRQGTGKHIRDISFSTDGKQLVIANGVSWEVRDIDKRVLVSQGQAFDSVRRVAFSADATQIASGSDDGSVRIWDAKAGTCSTVLGEGKSKFHLYSVIFSPDDKFVATSSFDDEENKVCIWEVEKGICLCELNGHYGKLMSWDQNGLHAHHGTIVPNGDSFEGRMANVRFDRKQPWILKGSEPVVRVPWEYRPICSAASPGVLAWGCRSGQVMFLRFSPDASSSD